MEPACNALPAAANAQAKFVPRVSQAISWRIILAYRATVRCLTAMVALAAHNAPPAACHFYRFRMGLVSALLGINPTSIQRPTNVAVWGISICRTTHAASATKFSRIAICVPTIPAKESHFRTTPPSCAPNVTTATSIMRLPKGAGHVPVSTQAVGCVGPQALHAPSAFLAHFQL